MPGSVRDVALTLTVDRVRWREHVAATRTAFPGLVPVVKGNGYGFGLTYLAELVSSWGLAAAPELAVGTVHELAGLPPDGPRPLVLTPALARELPIGVGPAVLTVGSRAPRRRAGGGRPPPAGHRQAGQSHAPLRGGARRPARAPGRGRPRRAVPSTGSPSTRRWRARATTTSRPSGAGCLPLPAGALVYASHLDAAGYAAVRAWR